MEKEKTRQAFEKKQRQVAIDGVWKACLQLAGSLGALGVQPSAFFKNFTAHLEKLEKDYITAMKKSAEAEGQNVSKH